MIKREAGFALSFRSWIRSHRIFASSAFELKQTTGHLFYFKNVKVQQLEYARAIFSDTGAFIRVIGFNGEPDYILLKNSYTYFVIKYPHCFVGIRSDFFEDEMLSSKTKSLTSARAKEIGAFHCEL